MALTCHVTYKNKKEIIKGDSSEEVLACIKKTFGISHELSLQKYHKQFEDWVDIDSNSIEDMCRLNIKNSTKQCLSTEGEGGPVEVAVPVAEALHLESVEPMSSQTQSIKPSIRQATVVQLSRWPVPFKLPIQKFRPTLMKALAEKQHLDFGQKQCLLAALYDEMTMYTFRPSPGNYKEVVTTLLAAYPFLKNGLVGRDAVDYWKTSLSNKFRNERKRNEKDNPLAAQPKKAKPTPKATQELKKQQTPKSLYVKNYLPTRPMGENDATITAHLKILQEESLKRRQDSSLIKELMDVTFAERRDHIVNNHWSVKKMKEVYPCLFDKDEIYAEIERLTGDPLQHKLEEGINKYRTAILKLDYSTQGQTVKDEVEAFVSLATAEDSIKRIYSSGILLLVPLLLGEKLESILSPQNKKRESPDAHIVHTGNDNKLSTVVDDHIEFKLVTEGQVVCQTNDLTAALCLLLSIHYVFDLQYSKKCVNTMCFLQKVLCNITDSTVTPTKVIKLMFRINTILAQAGNDPEQ